MERAQLIRLVEATGVAERHGEFFLLRDPQRPGPAPVMPADAARGWLGVPTGGSGGVVRWARHDEHTLGAAAEGFRRHFGLPVVNAVDVLPAYHVSGLMARVRATVSGGRHLPWAWKRLEAGDRPGLDGPGWVISLVPTQLQRLLADPAATAWLRGFAAVLLGGGPSWPALDEAAAAARLPLAPSYGLTETAAMVAALRPQEFLAGRRGAGRALPHARIQTGPDGRLVIEAASLFRGYFPEERAPGEWVTDDLGSVEADGRVQVAGRADAVIISGGRKVHPARVEEALRTPPGLGDVVVLGVPDPVWGESVVACHPASEGILDPGSPRLVAALAGLAPWERPKRYVAVDPWPRSAQGKVDRAALRRRLAG